MRHRRHRSTRRHHRRHSVARSHLIISSVELYCFNIGEGLFSEWEKYTSVKLYLVLSYTVLI
jgi:hypothetical protein